MNFNEVLPTSICGNSTHEMRHGRYIEKYRDATPEDRAQNATQKDLAQVYGLTQRQITRLGAPDGYRINPHCWGGPPMKLYAKDRVERFINEIRPEYDLEQGKRLRCAAARQARLVSSGIVER